MIRAAEKNEPELSPRGNDAILCISDFVSTRWKQIIRIHHAPI